jgi:hypothetical protein
MGTHDFDGSTLDNKTTSLYDQFSTQLSLSSSNDGEEIATSSCPDKECPLAILSLSLKSFKQDAAEEDAVKWSLEENSFPFILSDSKWGDSSYASSLSEQSSTISTPSTPFTVQSDSQSEDLDRTDIWVSSLDLEAEDSALLPDKEQFQDALGFDFPSPSFNAIRSLQFGPSSYSTGILQSKETNGPSSYSTGILQSKETKDSDEPIFWPFERTCYNSPEFDKFLSVSPRRNTMDLGYAEVRHLNPVLQRLRKSTLSSVKKCVEPCQGTRNSSAKGSMASSQEKIQKTPAVPSRLSRTTKAPAPSGHHQKRRPPHLKLGGLRKVSSPQLQADHSTKTNEASDVQKLADKKSRIEELIGLDEFDGHEGLGSDSSDHQFSLWISPR